MKFNVNIDEDRIDQVFAKLDQCLAPGAAVGISLGGRPVYRRGFGLANAEQPCILSPTMRMRIGSTSKQFTALAFLLLCEEGRANIDDPIGAHLPEIGPASASVSVESLLSHMSGLRDAYDICWQFSGTGQHLTSVQILSLYQQFDDTNCDPGEAWIYNNGGYALVAAAIERIADTPFENFLRERIFEPIGMNETLLRRFDTDFVSNSATLHMEGDNGAFVKDYLGTASAGQGGIVSTVDDMLRWLAHMDRPGVGSEASWKSLRRPRTTRAGSTTGYGLGLFAGTYRGLRLSHHPGGVMGGNAQALKAPDIGLDIVVLVNRHDVSGVALANAVLDTCVEGLSPIVEQDSAPVTTGVFRSRDTGRVVVLSEDAGCQRVAINGAAQKMVRDAEGCLQPPSRSSLYGDRVCFPARAGTCPQIEVHSFGSHDFLDRMRPYEASAKAVEGNYRHRATGTRLSLETNGDDRLLKSVGTFGQADFCLEPLAEGLWHAKATKPGPRGGMLSASLRDDTISFSTSRTRPFIFERCQ